MAYIILYVVNIILTTLSVALLRNVVRLLSAEFAMKDLGPLHHFLGISVSRSSVGVHLSQCQYTQDLLSHAGMSICNSVATPIDLCSKLPTNAGPPVSDVTHYRSMAGALQYMNFTRHTHILCCSPNLSL